MLVVAVEVFTTLLDLTQQQMVNQQVEQVVVLMVLDQNHRDLNHGILDQQETL
jgi:hypothetical protein